MNEKDRVDALFRLADAAWHSFERRSSYEWQVSFALWSALGLFSGFVLGGRVHFSSPASVRMITILICAFLWSIYAMVWTPGLYRRNQYDKQLADYFWGKVEKEFGLEVRKSYPPTSHWNWSHGTQIAVTSGLMALAIVSVFLAS